MKITAVILAVLGALVLSSCNTISGLGRDMQNAGNTLERNAAR